MDETEDCLVINSKDRLFGKDVERAQEENEHEEEKPERILRLPVARVRHIMKMDPDVHHASQEAVFLITKSTVRVTKCFDTTQQL
jgi:hypothetical protein